MVLQSRLDYGFNGYQEPRIPRAARSVRVMDLCMFCLICFYFWFDSFMILKSGYKSYFLSFVIETA